MNLARICRNVVVVSALAAAAVLFAGSQGRAALLDIPLDPTGATSTVVTLGGSLPGNSPLQLDFVLTLNGDFAGNPALAIDGAVVLLGSNGAFLIAAGSVDAAGPDVENITGIDGLLAKEMHFLLTLLPSNLSFVLEVQANLLGNGIFAPKLSVELPDGLAETPLPAALPLFAGGLGVLSLLGWRKRRRDETRVS